MDPHTFNTKRYFGHGTDPIYQFQQQYDLESFESIVDKLHSGEKWADHTDLNFPAIEGSYARPTLAWPEDIPCWRGATPKLAAGGTGEASQVHFSDIQQGQLGDGWFLAALVTAVENGCVKYLFRRCDEEKGVYEFRFFDHDNGMVHTRDVCVDSRIPIVSGDNTPCFCYSDDDGELWPSLIEKAFAKLIISKRGKPVRGYEAMHGGVTAVALSHMIAGEGEVRDFQMVPAGEELASEIHSLLRSKHLMTVAFKEDRPIKKVRGPLGQGEVTKGTRGLVAHHAYSLFTTKAVTLRNGDLCDLVQLRNPYGGGHNDKENLEWHGDWCDDHPLWDQNPDAKRTCLTKYDNNNDGVFWMPVSDLASEIEKMHVCKINEGVLKQDWPAKRYHKREIPAPEPVKPDVIRPPPAPIPKGPWYVEKPFFHSPTDTSDLELQNDPYETFETVTNQIGHGQIWQDDADVHTDTGVSLMYPRDIQKWKQHSKVIQPKLIGSEAGNVFEGPSGSSWLTSALQVVSVADYPKNLIGRTDPVKGVYEVNLKKWVPGQGFKDMPVCVDGRIPMPAHGNQSTPSYSHSTTPGVLWPSLTEKALAKSLVRRHDIQNPSLKGYRAINDTRPDGSNLPACVGVANLLGGDATVYDVTRTPPPEELEALMTRELTTKKPVLLTWKNEELTSQRGLIPHRSYTVLDIKKITPSNSGRAVSLVQLRHPHGARVYPQWVWNGDWGKGSHLWTEEMKAAVKYDMVEKDGQFWMPVEDVAKHVDTLEVVGLPRRVLEIPPPVRHEEPAPTPHHDALVVHKDPNDDELRRLRLELERERNWRIRLQNQVHEQQQTIEALEGRALTTAPIYVPESSPAPIVVAPEPAPIYLPPQPQPQAAPPVRYVQQQPASQPRGYSQARLSRPPSRPYASPYTGNL